MKPQCLSLILFALLAPAEAMAQRADLPPAELVNRALDNHPSVKAAAARVAAARAHSDMLRHGSHEVTLSSSYTRRNVEGFGGRNEFDVTMGRAFRLPGKAALDSQAGSLEVEVAKSKMEDVRHQTALVLSGLWHDWLTAGSHYRNDLATVQDQEKALAALRQRVTLRDAAAVDLDQASTALAQARAQAASSLAAREQARVTLAATFPDIVLPARPPELAKPVLPSGGIVRMRDLVIERSHEIRAADRDAQRLNVVSRRVREDQIADPTVGVRMFSEQGGLEKGAGVIVSIPLGGGYRQAAADQASAEASSAWQELANVRRTIAAIANADLSNARTRLTAWRSADSAALSAGEAVIRIRRGYELGQINLSDLLYAQRQSNEMRRYEIDARAEADRALLKLQIDSHSIWAPDEELGQ
ncbi:TolC family protein [Nitrobacter sp.]|uniref:TolC family protein n=1 Tax=Nitrobacter sp. TaxID=29420 RepID=UPI003F64EA7A